MSCFIAMSSVGLEVCVYKGVEVNAFTSWGGYPFVASRIHRPRTGVRFRSEADVANDLPLNLNPCSPHPSHHPQFCTRGDAFQKRG